MNVGIYDVDSKIPNLALMKVSQFHKEQGDDVEMYNPLWIDNYDKIYASKVFDFSDGSMLLEDRMVIGGTGWNNVNLPQEIEDCVPDYDASFVSYLKKKADLNPIIQLTKYGQIEILILLCYWTMTSLAILSGKIE